MALAVVSAESSVDSGASPHQITMPASVVSGNLLIAIVDRDAAPGNGTLTAPTGWSELVQADTTAFHLRYAVWYKVADETEGVDEDFATSIADTSAHHTYQISGQHASSAPEWSGLVGDTDTAPNAASFDPSWGSEETLWITGFFMRDPRAVTAVPTGYTEHPDSVVGADGSRVASAYKISTADSEDPPAWTIAAGGGIWGAWTIAVRAAAGGGTQEDVTAEFDFGSTLSGIASVNFPTNAELTSSTFNVSGQAESQGSGQEDIEATLEADFDVIDGDSLNIYVAGFSTLSSGFHVEGVTANEDVEHIDGTLTWSPQVNDLRVETLLENSGELSAGFQVENSSTILQLNASLNFQASLTGTTGLGKNPNEVIRTGTDFIDTGIDYVKNFDNQIVKTY